MGSTTNAPTRVALTDIPDSWAWMAPDLRLRLLPFVVVCVAAELLWRPAWLGLSPGNVEAQLTFAAIGMPVASLAGMFGQRALPRRRGGLLVPAGPAAAAVQ